MTRVFVPELPEGVQDDSEEETVTATVTARYYATRLKITPCVSVVLGPAFVPVNGIGVPDPENIEVDIA